MFVDRTDLTRFANLRLAAPGHATALQQGDRRSPFRGRGVEFSDYRPYDPGDDVRLVDWNVYMRLGTAVVRQFAEERSLAMRVCLDVSDSMGFSTGPRKADHAAQLAAALALVSLQHRDPFGLVCFGCSRPPPTVKASTLDGLVEVISVLEGVEPGGSGVPHDQIARLIGPRRSDRIVVVSDLLMEADELDRTLRLIASLSVYPVVLHVLGQSELEPEIGDAMKIVDSESGEELMVRDDANAMRDYHQGLDEWLENIQKRCSALRIRYVPTFTTLPVPDLMTGELRRAGLVEHIGGGAA
jgi:uncharacterized protein (DUF58 family)